MAHLGLKGIPDLLKGVELRCIAGLQTQFQAGEPLNAVVQRQFQNPRRTDDAAGHIMRHAAHLRGGAARNGKVPGDLRRYPVIFQIGNGGGIADKLQLAAQRPGQPDCGGEIFR